MLKIASVLLLLCMLVYQKAGAQNQSFRFEHIAREHGLSNNTVIKIIEDRKGYLWIGTANGLNKYDGYRFTQYKLDPLDSNSLSQNLVYTIWEDSHGFIWTGTFEGLCKFDRTTEKFTRYKPDPKSKFNDPNITAINEDNNGVMWIGGASGQLARFNKQTGKFYNENFDLGFRKKPGEPLLHDGISCIVKDNEGLLWIGNYTGLHKITVPRANTNQSPLIENYRNDPRDTNSLSSNSVSSVFKDHSGILWITTEKGLNKFDKRINKFTHFPQDPTNADSTSNAFGWGSIMTEDEEGNLWIATTKGLKKLNKDRTIFTSFYHDSSNVNSLKTNDLSTIYVDRSGVLWIGSSNDGLDKANLINKPFGLAQHDPRNKYSLDNNNVTALFEDKSGMMWVGTDGGGLNSWDKTSKRFTQYRHDPSDIKTLRYDYVNAIHEDQAGNLWVCNGDQLSLLNRKTGKFTHYNTNDADYQDADHLMIYSVTEDREGIIWLGTGNGVKSFDKKTLTFRHYRHDPSDSTGISDYTAVSIFADSKNNIWIGFGSIATDRLDKKTGKFYHYKHNPSDTNSISSNIVTSFFEDSKGNLWLGTYAGGMCRFDYTTGKFTTYTTRQGMPDNTVYSILEDDKNRLWLATANGLSKFDPVTRVFTNYDTKDGMPSNYFAAGHRDRPARFKSRDGTLLFGGPEGITFFNPEDLRPNNRLAPVVITQFNLYDRPVKGANESKEIVLEHNENYFSFEFSSLSFYNPPRNQYQYKLEGVDKDWVYSGTRRYAAYTDIGPGKYVFRVKATNNDGVWNEEGVSITVIIRPPWWRTWWAYCVYGLLFIVAIWRIHLYQKQRVIAAETEKAREKELAQAKEIQKAYHELKTTQQQLIQSEKMASLGELTAGIAHEIQNPLNFVNNFSEVNKELIDEMQEQWAMGNGQQAIAIASNIRENEEKIIYHGQRADAIVKGMLQHSRTSTGQKEPTDINALADEYLRLAYHGLRAKDKQFNATIETDFDKSIGKINIIPQDIGRALLNLVNNAFYAVNEKTKLRAASYEPRVVVTTKKIGDKIEIVVRDNGNGISQNIIDKIFQPFYTTKPAGQGTGLGLSLAYDIVKAHGGEIKVDAEEGKGTEFMIVLPNNVKQ